jgi:hypothetical protein
VEAVRDAGGQVDGRHGWRGQVAGVEDDQVATVGAGVVDVGQQPARTARPVVTAMSQPIETSRAPPSASMTVPVRLGFAAASATTSATSSAVAIRRAGRVCAALAK